jgi:hypothetical protein
MGDPALVRQFARGGATGYSGRFHVEGETLLVDRDVPAALRISPGALLVRRDLPDGLEAARSTVEQALVAEGMGLLDSETLLGVPVGIQLAGLRLSSWDLWGTDLDEAFAALRRAATGDSFLS